MTSAAGAQTIGQTGPPNPGVANYAWTQDAVSAGGPSYSPSARGVITSWSAMADASPGRTLMLLVLAPGAGVADFITRRKDQLRILTQANQLNTFTGIRLPIEPSERLGLWTGPPGAPGPPYFTAGAGNFARNAMTGDPPLGTSMEYGGAVNFARLNASALVEPDLDLDNFGDETQDRCLGSAGQFNGCPDAVSLSKPRFKNGKVRVRAEVPGPGTLNAGSASDPDLAGVAKSRTQLKQRSQEVLSPLLEEVVLKLKLTKRARKKLERQGELKIRVKAVFTPTGGQSGADTAKAKLQD